MKRRNFLNAATALAAGSVFAATPAQAQSSSDESTIDTPPEGARTDFGFEDVAAIAAKRAEAVHEQPVAKLVGSFADLNYDQYRGIRFRRDADPLSDQNQFGMDLLPPGAIFYEPIGINIVRDGVPQKFEFDPRLLDFDPAQFPDGANLDDIGDMGWSGFRLRTRLNRPDVMDEFAVFQGASYFRAVARGTLYGLSARGLAIKTGSPDGEEFPLFTDFWIDRPSEGSEWVRIHALLDSKSVTGAYQFDINPGAVTMVRTRLALFPRVDLQNTGIAPLTSMFWFSPASRRAVDDYRPAVHDSDGLQMHTGAGQALWRSLASHKNLQISSFVDKSPRGFGLIQRNRDFGDYQDAEAMYNQRPSAWIQPESDWGEGEVRLIEIPVENEFNDNIVTYWLPKDPLARGKRHDFRYRLSFAPLPPNDMPLAKVRQVRSGQSINNKDLRSFVVDFDLSLFGGEMPESKVTTSAGTIVHAYLKTLADQGVLRLAFEFEPGDATVADLQALLTDKQGVALSESWLARWSA